MLHNRRSFLSFSLLPIASAFTSPNMVSKGLTIMTVAGGISGKAMGMTLTHEHILVDFSGAKNYDPGKWDRKLVIEKILPLLLRIKALGCNTFIDCTPAYLGRDVLLLRELSDLSRLNILTNTGYYGGSDNKFLPQQAFDENAEALAARWIEEAMNGIDGTEVRPGFIKISVNDGDLSDVSRKLITAAGITHKQTGLPIASHTGPSLPAFQQLDILEFSLRIDPKAFIWVHAQTEKDLSSYVKAAQRNCWISLDGVNETNIADYIRMLSFLKEENCLDHALVSHDAGWYDPGKPEATIRGYETIFVKLIPGLRGAGFSEKDIEMVFRENPQRAFTIKKP
jgi:phosphotriesterase-related protein